MFQAFKTFFRKTEIRGNGEKKNGSNPVHFHQTRNVMLILIRQMMISFAAAAAAKVLIDLSEPSNNGALSNNS